MINMGNNAKIPDVLHGRKILISLIYLLKPNLPDSAQRYSKFDDLEIQ